MYVPIYVRILLKLRTRTDPDILHQLFVRTFQSDLWPHTPRFCGAFSSLLILRTLLCHVSIQDGGRDKPSDDLADAILHAAHVRSVQATPTKSKRQPFIYFYFLQQLGLHSSPGTVNSKKQHHLSQTNTQD
ncbi:unnamed protein product [Ixodes pacificus]